MENFGNAWEIEKKKRTHLVSMNSDILRFFNHDLGKILKWTKKIGMHGLEVRPQDLFGFSGSVDRKRVSSLRKSAMVFGFHLSDTQYAHQHRKVSVKEIPATFAARRAYASTDKKFFDHLPIGITTNKMATIIDFLNPEIVTHELKAQTLELLEKAYAVQKYQLIKAENST